MITVLNTRILLSLIFAGALVLNACGKKKDDDEGDEEAATIGEKNSGGGASKSSSNLEDVTNSMLPGSLDIGTSLRLEGDGPCEDTDGFFDCQPTLLKLYAKMAKDIMGMSQEVYDSLRDFIDELEVGTSGSVDPGEDGIEKIEYDVTSETEYEVLVHSEAGPFMYLKVNESKKPYSYEVKFKAENAPEEDMEGMGTVASDISFSSDDDFSIDITIAGRECDDSDVRAPQTIKLAIVRDDGQVAGKAMMYSPIWRGSASSCDETADSTTDMHMFTNFVGNDDETVAALYLFGSGPDTAAEMADYPASAFCTNYSDNCTNGYGLGDSNLVSSYTNNFCVTEDDATWGTNCDDVDADDFTSNSAWDFNLSDADIDFPSEL